MPNIPMDCKLINFSGEIPQALRAAAKWLEDNKGKIYFYDLTINKVPDGMEVITIYYSET